MIAFPRGVEFKIGFAESGDVMIWGEYEIAPGISRHFQLIGFHALKDAKALGQMIVDFCDENEVKVPEVFIKALEEDNETQAFPGNH